VQLLWVNLVMDTLGALALATEPPQSDILKRPPYKKDNPIVTEVMWRNIFGHAIWQIILLSTVLLAGPKLGISRAYLSLCVTFKDDGSGECVTYNPFYARELYFNLDEQTFWAQ